MEYITHDEFDTRVRTLGFHAYYWEDQVQITNSEKEVICTVYEHNMYSLSTEYYAFHELDEYYKKELIRLCVQLASTPSRERKRIKKYRLKVKPQYQPFFSDGHIYLRKAKYSDMFGISNIDYDYFDNSVFTEDDLIEISEEYDLSLFEKLEVEDEQ